MPGIRRRRGLLLATTMLASLIMASGIAFAVNKVCPSGTIRSDPCKGTARTTTSTGDDTLIGTPGPDFIFALSGNDRISAGAGDDFTNGAAGNDTYAYADGMGIDTVVDASGVDTLNFSARSSGIRASLFPDNGMSPANIVSDLSFAPLVRVSSNTGTVFEKVVGSAASGDDFIQTGGAANTLQPGPGPGGATLIDIGGCDSNNQAFPPDCGDPPVPVSNDTYSGFRGSGYGAVRIGDFGGTADKLVLPFASTDAYFEASDSDGNGSFESLMIMSTNMDFVFIFGQLRRYLGRSGHIETIQFTDGNFSIGGASTSDSVTPRIDALNAASRLGAAKKGELARTARNAISKMQAPYESP